jgi:hypothetical protein
MILVLPLHLEDILIHTHELKLSASKLYFTCRWCDARHRIDSETLSEFSDFERKRFGPYQSDDPIVMSASKISAARDSLR